MGGPLCFKSKGVTRFIFHKKKREFSNLKSFSFKVLPSVIESIHTKEIGTLFQNLSFLAETEVAIVGIEWTLLFVHLMKKKSNKQI